MATARLRAVALTAAFVALGLCAGAVLSAPAHAQNAGTVEIAMPQQGVGFTSGPTPPLLNVRDLIPGGSVAGVMEIRNTSGSAEDISLQMIDVKTLDTCSAGGKPCADASTSLLSSVRFTLEVAEREFGTGSTETRRWSGTASDLENRHGIAVVTNAPDRAVRWVRLTATLPELTGNSAQYGAFSFDLRLNMKGAQGNSAHVIGPHGRTTSGHGVLGLAATGIRTGLFVIAAMILLLAGLLLLLAGHRQRRQTIDHEPRVVGGNANPSP